jgi:preprotein translocase subunit SecG
MIQIFFSIVFVVVCIILIVMILVQKGRGGGLAGAFGGGGSETWLGGLQSKEIVRWTTWLAAAFFVLTILRDFVPPKRVGADVEDLMGASTTTSAPAEQQPAGDTAGPGGTSASQPAEAPPPAGSSAPVPAAPAPPAAPPAAPPGQGGAQ